MQLGCYLAIHVKYFPELTSRLFLADTDGLIREEVSRTTTLPSFMTTNTQASTSTKEAVKQEPDENVPEDIATFYQVKNRILAYPPTLYVQL